MKLLKQARTAKVVLRKSRTIEIRFVCSAFELDLNFFRCSGIRAWWLSRERESVGSLGISSSSNLKATSQMALRFTALFLVATRNSKVQNGNAISNFIFEIKYTWKFQAGTFEGSSRRKHLKLKLLKLNFLLNLLCNTLYKIHEGFRIRTELHNVSALISNRQKVRRISGRNFEWFSMWSLECA